MTPSKLLLLGGGSWHPRKLWLGSELGTVQVPSISSAFQEFSGATPGAVGSLVGKLLDERLNLETGAERVTNGGFDDGTGWTLGDASVTISGGALRFASTPNAISASQTVAAAVVATTYLITVVVSSYTAGTIRVQHGGTSRDISAAGTATMRLTATSTSTSLALQAIGTTTAVIDSISVVTLAGSHAQQTTAGSRPTLETASKINFSAGAKSLVTTWASSLGTSCTVGRSIPQGEATILTGQTIATTYTDTTDHCGLVIINRDLTATETNKLRRWLNRRAG
jgi:hypothetical protein